MQPSILLYDYFVDNYGNSFAPNVSSSFPDQTVTISESGPSDGILRVGDSVTVPLYGQEVDIDTVVAFCDQGIITLDNWGFYHLLSRHPNLSSHALTNINTHKEYVLATGELRDPGSVPCYLAGTLIETTEGPVAVEDLVPGQRLRTLSGGTRPLIWVGHRKVSAEAAARSPAKTLPVRFAPGCLGPDLPRRALWVSPDHALHHDGALVQAKNLINGTSVTQAAPGRAITYYHLLLDAHDVILAEGAGAESYRPCNNAWTFMNGASFPEGINPAQPRKMSCLPVVSKGEKVEALHALLAAHQSPAEDLAA